MKLLLDGYNKTIHKNDNHIIIKDNKEVIFDDLAEKIDNITILGKGHITFDALTLLTKNNANIISITYSNQVNYIINNINNQTTVTLLKKQVYYSDSKQAITTSQEIIKSKIKNQMNTLKTLNKNKEDKEIKNNIKKLEENIKNLDKTRTKNEIRGIEGICSQTYWSSIKKIIPEEFNFYNRSKKPATDLFNAMLNYGYAILSSQVTIKILEAGLNPDIGLLHSDLNNRHSLTYDLIEEFRQQIVDKTMIAMINNKQIKVEDYEDQIITLEKRKVIIEKILKKMKNKINYKNHEKTYDEILEEQVTKLKESILNDTIYEGFYLNW